MYRITACLLSVSVAATPLQAAEALVAVASNFLTTAQRLETAFEAAVDHEVTLVHGSTGRLYAQVRAGAPFDLFLAADTQRPSLLSEAGRSVEQATYAIGRLVVVSHGAADLSDALTDTRFAMADPDVAPYGAAARQALMALGLTEDRAVYGESVGQAANLFATGNADAAFLAASQIPDLPKTPDVFPVTVDGGVLAQDMVLLSDGNEAAVAFFRYVLSDDGRRIIADAGYEVPK